MRAAVLYSFAGGESDTARQRELYAQVLESLDVVLKIGKADAALYRLRGTVHHKLGKAEEARDDYTRVLQAEPKAAEIWARRGWVYLLLLDAPKLALPDFDRAVQFDPGSADALLGRGGARVKLGSYREATSDAEEALKRDPERPRTLLHAARIYAQAAGKVETEALAVKRRVPEHQARYQDRALTLLQQALNRTPSGWRPALWRDAVKPDAAFNAIRHSAGYQQLRTQYGNAPK
jgi:tetratricopeptide (TPR) repeat protein